MKITVGIKSFNEERHVAAAIASAIEAVRSYKGEVILADCGSRDRTIEIAKAFNVRIVQLANPDDRSCGAGAQLAFQNARGDYFYLLDADMVLDQQFVSKGIAYLEQNPHVAGVGGRICEMNTEGQDFAIRANSEVVDRRTGIVDRLDCGGLYRTSAIREVGYFADRNLHSFEEFELGARLRAKGWQLARIDQAAVDHYGHTANGYHLLWRRLKSGYAGGAGEVLRSAIGQRHFVAVLRDLAHVRNGIIVLIWWLAVSIAWIVPSSLQASISIVAALLLIPLVALSVRRRSLRLGVYSLASWNVSACGLITGFLRRRTAPEASLNCVDLSQQLSNAKILNIASGSGLRSSSVTLSDSGDAN